MAPMEPMEMGRGKAGVNKVDFWVQYGTSRLIFFWEAGGGGFPSIPAELLQKRYPFSSISYGIVTLILIGAACAKKLSLCGELVKMLFMEAFCMVRDPFRIFLSKQHSKCQHQPACLKVETRGASQQVPWSPVSPCWLFAADYCGRWQGDTMLWLVFQAASFTLWKLLEKTENSAHNNING